MGLANFDIHKQIKMRLARKFRRGLLNHKTEAERVFESLLHELKVDYIPQAAFLSPKSFYIVDFYIKSPYKAIIEINGDDHNKPSKAIFDKDKYSYFTRSGFRMYTFPNSAVLGELEKVRRQLKAVLKYQKLVKTDLME